MSANPVAPESPAFKPAQVFHPSEYIATEAIARGWSLFDVASRMGGDVRMRLAELEFYAINAAPECDREMDILLGEDGAKELERAFGADAETWLNMERFWRDNPDARTPMDADSPEWKWYNLDRPADAV